jgi:hypothetical protein
MVEIVDDKRKSRQTKLWVAGISAIGAVAAAFVGLMAHRDATSIGQNISGDRNVVASAGGVAAGRDINGNIYNAPVHNTYNRFSNPFKEKNGLLFSGPQMSAIFFPNRPSDQLMGVGVLNVSSRRIERAQFLVFDASRPGSNVPYAASEQRTVGQHETLLPNNRLPIHSEPPKAVRICLTYESDRPGVFVTLLVTMERGPASFSNSPNMYSYSTASDYQIFYSSTHADCQRTTALETIPNSDYFGRS